MGFTVRQGSEEGKGTKGTERGETEEGSSSYEVWCADALRLLGWVYQWYGDSVGRAVDDTVDTREILSSSSCSGWGISIPTWLSWWWSNRGSERDTPWSLRLGNPTAWRCWWRWVWLLVGCSDGGVNSSTLMPTFTSLSQHCETNLRPMMTTQKR